ncbi:glycosyltransferase [Cellulomonas sp.]|uniref:glycosyltransferase n=1 Tax=Cellulomonas sp. TaxID=40001 RepID=UPI003BAD96A0
MVSPSFFGYEHAITQALRDAGLETRFLDERPANSAFARGLFRAIPRLTRPWSEVYFRQARRALADVDLDLVLVIKGELTPRTFLDELRRDHPRAVVVYYAYDSMAESGGYARLRDLVDVALTFDRDDLARDSALRYYPLFYTHEFRTGDGLSGWDHDVAFIGTVNPERYSVARAMSREFPNSFVHLYSPARWYVPLQKLRSPKYRAIDTRHVSTVKLPRSAVADVFRRSRVVVDQQKSGQGGLTMRTFEALASGAGLVTSNETIRAEAFYDDQRVAVVPHDDPTATVTAVRTMLTSGSARSTPDSFAEHSIDSWVRGLLTFADAWAAAAPRETAWATGSGAAPLKVVFDVMGAPQQSGGMNLYASELVRSWHALGNGDRLTVVGGSWAKDAFSDLAGVRVRTAPDANVVGRSLTQLVGTAMVYWRSGADAVVSASPIVTPLVPRSARVCVVHDWRHIKNPHEFSSAQRVYRQLWRASARWAGRVVAISSKTARETRAINPGAQPVVVENGRDHARRWIVSPLTNAVPSIVTFGHHPNKRPELVIDAVAKSDELREARAVLTILGARGEYAHALRQMAVERGIGSMVELPGFVDSDDYERIISGASVVVLASSDEGFGLPVAEAQFFGVPVVATSDSGLDELHTGLIVAEPDGPALSRALALAAGNRGDVRAEGSRAWADTAAELRDVVTDLQRPHRVADAVGVEG